MKIFNRAKKWLWLAVFIFLAYSFSFLASHSMRQTKNIASKNVERIVSLNLAATEILIKLGLNDQIVGVTLSKNNPEIVKEKPKVGKSFGDLNLEAILALEPDIAFAGKSDSQILKEKGIPVFVVDTYTLEEVVTLTREVGKTVNREAEACKIADRMEERINLILERLKDIKVRPLVYFESGPIGHTRASGSLTHDLITLAGGENLAKDELSSFPLLSNEYIINRNPDIIIVEDYGVPVEAIKGRDVWQDIKAIKNNKVFKSPVYYTNYTSRSIDGLEQFARWFHPELFKE